MADMESRLERRDRRGFDEGFAGPPPAELSVIPRIFVGILAVVGLLYLIFEGVGAFFLFLAACLIAYGVYQQAYRLRYACDVDRSAFVTQMALGFGPGAVAAIILEIIPFIIILVIFASSLMQEANDHPNDEVTLDGGDRVRLIFMFFFISFIAAALVEESVKYILMARFRRRVPPTTPRAMIIFGIAGALGFAFLEHILYSVVSVSGADAFFVALLLGIGRSMIAFPLHCGTGAYIGARMAQSELQASQLTYWQAIKVPVLVHGTLNFQAFFIAVLALPSKIDFRELTKGQSNSLNVTEMLVTIFIPSFLIAIALLTVFYRRTLLPLLGSLGYFVFGVGGVQTESHAVLDEDDDFDMEL